LDCERCRSCGLDATTAGDGEEGNRDEDTELAATAGDCEDVAEGEATRITAAPTASDGNGNSGDIVRDEATKLDGAATVGTSEDGAASEAPRLASNASGEDEDRAGVEVESTNHARFSLPTGTLYHLRLSIYLRTLVHEMAHAYFLAYGCLCGKCLCEKVVRECWGTDGHGACWRIVMQACEGAVGRLLRLGEEEGREGFNWLERWDSYRLAQGGRRKRKG